MVCAVHPRSGSLSGKCLACSFPSAVRDIYADNNAVTFRSELIPGVGHERVIRIIQAPQIAHISWALLAEVDERRMSIHEGRIVINGINGEVVYTVKGAEQHYLVAELTEDHRADPGS